jgi:hypothetical protein
MTCPEPPGIVHLFKKQKASFVTGVLHKSKKLGYGCGAKVFLLMPQYRAGAITACAQDAVDIGFKLVFLFGRLKTLLLGRLITVGMKPRLNALIGIPEWFHIHHQIFNNLHVGKRFHKYLVPDE